MLVVAPFKGPGLNFKRSVPERRSRLGRKRSTGASVDRYIMSQALQSWRSTYNNIKNNLEEDRNVNISVCIVRKRHIEVDIHSQSPPKCYKKLSGHRIEILICPKLYDVDQCGRE